MKLHKPIFFLPSTFLSAAFLFNNRKSYEGDLENIRFNSLLIIIPHKLW